MGDRVYFCKNCCIKYELINEKKENIYNKFGNDFINTVRDKHSCILCNNYSHNYFMTTRSESQIKNLFPSQEKYEEYLNQFSGIYSSDPEYFLTKLEG